MADLIDRLVFGGQVIDVPGQSRGRLGEGFPNFQGWPTLTAAVKMMGAVSPAARPMLMMMPVRMPGRAAGSSTVSTMRSGLAPKAEGRFLVIMGHGL